jgi:L-lactate dehydrogenase complex protein LldE
MSLKLFIPCLVDQFAPHLGEAVVELLARLEVPWAYPREQTCCGQFAYTVGDLSTTRKLMGHFLEVFEGAEVLCPGASCTHMVRIVYPQLAQSPGEQQRLSDLAGGVWELSEWLAARGPLPWQPRFTGSLVLHRSCKARQLGLFAGAARVLSQVAGLEVLSVSPYYSCCGFGGAFSLQQPELSRALGEAYLEAVRATGAQGLVSLDYGCLQHLEAIARSRDWELKFYHLAEILLGE